MSSPTRIDFSGDAGDVLYYPVLLLYTVNSPAMLLPLQAPQESDVQLSRSAMKALQVGADASSLSIMLGGLGSLSGRDTVPGLCSPIPALQYGRPEGVFPSTVTVSQGTSSALSLASLTDKGWLTLMAPTSPLPIAVDGTDAGHTFGADMALKNEATKMDFVPRSMWVDGVPMVEGVLTGQTTGRFLIQINPAAVQNTIDLSLARQLSPSARNNQSISLSIVLSGADSEQRYQLDGVPLQCRRDTPNAVVLGAPLLSRLSVQFSPRGGSPAVSLSVQKSA